MLNNSIEVMALNFRSYNVSRMEDEISGLSCHSALVVAKPEEAAQNSDTCWRRSGQKTQYVEQYQGCNCQSKTWSRRHAVTHADVVDFPAFEVL